MPHEAFVPLEASHPFAEFRLPIVGGSFGSSLNSRNDYRRREWDTRAGTVELSIPKLHCGSYFPSSWLPSRAAVWSRRWSR
jgi:hypothetical protein